MTAGSDPALDALTKKTSQMFGVPIAAVTFVRADTQVMKCSTGIDPAVLPRAQSFCDTTIRHAGHLVVEDATLDPRYADFPIVTEAPGIRFYAGYPIESPTGQKIGALCVMDTVPRHFTEHEASILRTLALIIQHHLYERS